MIHLCWHNSKCHFNCGNQRYIKIRCAWGKDFERLIPEWWRDELKHKIKQCQICLQALVAGQLLVSTFQKVVYNYYCISKHSLCSMSWMQELQDTNDTYHTLWDARRWRRRPDLIDLHRVLFLCPASLSTYPSPFISLYKLHGEAWASWLEELREVYFPELASPNQTHKVKGWVACHDFFAKMHLAEHSASRA